ncbi:metallophosphoesterase family protein [Salinithrix halophila]|uniref:Exonuclease SbcCD subunit D n=1 Tax=Salinithrix halophila TaxID=1485204 RepID=A0ABV8JG89_9BACL
MKPVTFIHTADLHLDLPVRGWKGSEEQLLTRRDDYRRTFRRIVDLAGSREADFLLIAGDFLEHETVRRSTVEWVIDTLERIPSTQVLIAPGNHDPLQENSFYRTVQWPENVHIFSGEWEERYYPEFGLRVFGRGFTQYEEREVSLPHPSGAPDERRMMLVHGTFNSRSENCPYYPLTEESLAPLEMDYIALGHIHRPSSHYLKNQRKTCVRYPGSPEALQWKETGERTVTLGRFDEQGLQLEMVSIQSRCYEKDEIDLTGCGTEEEVLNRILDRYPAGDARKACRKVLLKGRRPSDLPISPEWLTLHLSKENFFYVDIVDQTVPDYQVDQLAATEGLTGSFVRRMQRRLEEASPEGRDVLERALSKGLDALLTPGVNR